MSTTVVICDGSVAGLVAAGAAGIRAATGTPPGRAFAWLHGPTEFHLQAAARHAGEFGLSALTEHEPSGTAPAVWRTVLLEAALEARKLGGGEVIWPVTFPIRAGQPDLWGTSSAMSAALLVSQLASLSLDRDEPQSMVAVRALYADLSERQLVDLVLDMDLPIWTCWWMAASKFGTGVVQAQARAELEKWSTLLKDAGWAGSLDAKAEVVVRPGAIAPTRTPVHRGDDL